MVGKVPLPRAAALIIITEHPAKAKGVFSSYAIPELNVVRANVKLGLVVPV